MQLDYIHNINAFGDHVVRLYDFGMDEAKALRDAISQVVLGTKQPLDLSQLDFVKPRNCTLVLHLTDEDAGIITMNGNNFVCALTEASYQLMIEHLLPYCSKHTTGYKYLYDLDTEIDFLLSPAGTW